MLIQPLRCITYRKIVLRIKTVLTTSWLVQLKKNHVAYHLTDDWCWSRKLPVYLYYTTSRKIVWMISTTNGYQENRQAAVAGEGRPRGNMTREPRDCADIVVVGNSEATITTRLARIANRWNVRRLATKGDFLFRWIPRAWASRVAETAGCCTCLKVEGHSLPSIPTFHLRPPSSPLPSSPITFFFV